MITEETIRHFAVTGQSKRACHRHLGITSYKLNQLLADMEPMEWSTSTKSPAFLASMEARKKQTLAKKEANNEHRK